MYWNYGIDSSFVHILSLHSFNLKLYFICIGYMLKQLPINWLKNDFRDNSIVFFFSFWIQLFLFFIPFVNTCISKVETFFLNPIQTLYFIKLLSCFLCCNNRKNPGQYHLYVLNFNILSLISSAVTEDREWCWAAWWASVFGCWASLSSCHPPCTHPTLHTTPLPVPWPPATGILWSGEHLQ